MEGTDVFEEKLAGLLEEAKKKKNVLEYQEVMNYFGQEPPVSNQLDRLFEFLDQNKVDVIRMGTEDELDPDLFIEEEMELDEEEENVKVTVQFLMAQDLLKLIDESEYELTECSRMVGSESASAERMRRLRDKKTSQCDIGVTQPLHLGDVEKEIEIDKEKDNKNISLELKDSKQNTFISLPLVTGSGNYDVTLDYLNSLRELFPALDVEQEFRSMAAWLDSHPRNRKTPRGIKRFITGWLERSQNSMPASRTPQAPAATKNMSTNQYMEQRPAGAKGWVIKVDTSRI